MSLWPRNKPLNQPPQRGRISAQPQHVKPCPIATDATAAVKGTQFARKDTTRKLGQRAVVKG